MRSPSLHGLPTSRRKRVAKTCDIRGRELVALTLDLVVSEYVAAVQRLTPTELQNSLESVTFALSQLHQHQYSIENALVSARDLIAHSNAFRPSWTQEEIDQFESSISRNGSDLHEVHKDVCAD